MTVMRPPAGPTEPRRCGRTPPRRAPRRARSGRRRRAAQPRRPRCPRPAAAQRRPQRLAALGEGGVDRPRTPARGWPSSRAGRGAPGDTSPESTLGTGQKTLRATSPTAADVGVPGGLHRRHAVGARAGRSGEPVGHLGLHHDEPLLQRGEQREQVQQDGHRDVVGQVRDQRGRRRVDDRSSRRASASTTVSRSARSGACSSTVRGSRAARRPSISTATTCRATSSSARVREPRPGPISRTTSSGPTPDVPDDPAHGVAVDHEVLAALLARPQVELVGQPPDLGGAEQATAVAGLAPGMP